jgi:di/tricarboxylate transporter
MKEVFNNDEIAFGVLAGLTRAFKSTGTKDWISGLLITSPNHLRLLFTKVRT